MALIHLAVVGKENEPLYLRDLKCQSTEETSVTNPEEDNNLPDPFGFFSEENSPCESASFHHMFLIHAALDRLHEITKEDSKWRSAQESNTGSDAFWVGLLCPIEDLRIYGYLTNSNIKLLAIVEDKIDSSHHARETELKTFFSNIHELYIEYKLNPFSDIKANSKIISKRFDVGVLKYVNICNQKHTKKDMHWM